MKIITDKLLWDYIDGVLSEEEKKEIDELCFIDESLARKLQSMKGFDQVMFENAELQFKPSPDLKSKILYQLNTVSAENEAKLLSKVDPKVLVPIFLLLFFCVFLTLFVIIRGVPANEEIASLKLDDKSVIVCLSALFVIAGFFFAERWIHYRKELKY